MTDTQETTERLTFLVDPGRLASGIWGNKANKTLGEGDIAFSYSADRIAMNKPVRGTFPWQGADWVCVGMGYNGGVSAQAYRLVDPRAFDGTPTSYHEKTLDGDAARSDPHGFYHGMTVKHAGRTFVLCGPCAHFEPGEVAQLSLFG